MTLQFKFFHISSRNYQESEKELNNFLRSHRVVTLHREFVADKDNSYWSFAVEFLADVPVNEKQFSGQSGKKRIDYKEALSAEDFAVFATLREWRKQAATEAGVLVLPYLPMNNLPGL